MFVTNWTSDHCAVIKSSSLMAMGLFHHVTCITRMSSTSRTQTANVTCIHNRTRFVWPALASHNSPAHNCHTRLIPSVAARFSGRGLASMMELVGTPNYPLWLWWPVHSTTSTGNTMTSSRVRVHWHQTVKKAVDLRGWSVHISPHSCLHTRLNQ